MTQHSVKFAFIASIGAISKAITVTVFPAVTPLRGQVFAHGVRIWLVRCTATPPEAAAWLSRDEWSRHAALRQPADQHRFATTRAALRGLLGRELGIAPAEVRVGAGPCGKPYVEASTDATRDASRVVFNASHAGDYALIAIGRQAGGAGVELGVDIERIDAHVDVDGLSPLVLSPAEAAWLAQRKAEARRTAFYRIWTAKEAFFKALGDGIGDQLPCVTVSLPEPGTDVLVATSTNARLAACAHRMTLRAIDVPHGYVATLAVHD